MTHSETWSSVYHAFEDLLETLDWLQTAVLADQDYPIWLDGLSDQITPYQQREQLCTWLNQLTYLPEQDPRASYIFPGFVACSPATLERLHAVNAAKLRFKELLVELRQRQAISVVHSHTFHREWLELPRERGDRFKPLLAQYGLQRLHLKQCYRLIPYVPGLLKQIRWSWANTRAIRQLTVADAWLLLDKKGQKSHLTKEKKALAALRSNEILAQVQQLTPHLRANIHYEGPETVEIKMIKGHLPLFYPATPHDSWPNYQKPLDKEQALQRHRHRRSDVKLCDQPFLPRLRLYRYLEPIYAQSNSLEEITEECSAKASS